MVAKRALTFLVGILSLSTVALCQSVGGISPRAFGHKTYREPVASVSSLPLTANTLGDIRLTLNDFSLHVWNGSSWISISGSDGSGEANTASNLGSGLVNFDSKAGVDLRFNSFDATDFNLASNLLSIDDSKWAKDSELPTDTNASTICAGTATYLDGEGDCDNLSQVYASVTHQSTHLQGGSDALMGTLAVDITGNAATADTADSATTAGNATGLACATCVDTGDISGDAVTYGKLQNVTSARLLGRSTAGAGDVEEISVGSGLSLSGESLIASGGSPGGVDTQVQFNDGGAFGGDAGLTFNKTTVALTLAGSLTAKTAAVGAAPSVGGVGSGFYAKAATGTAASLYLEGTGGISNPIITLVPTVGSAVSFGNSSDSAFDLSRSGEGATARLAPTASGSTFILNAGGAVCWKSSVDLAGTTDFCLKRSVAGNGGPTDGGSVVASWTTAKSITSVQALSIADNGNGGTRATSTLTPTTSYVTCTCSDPQGCDITISETNAVDGQELDIFNIGTNICGFSELAGVTEMSGALDLGENDFLSFRYVVNRFIQTGEADN